MDKLKLFEKLKSLGKIPDGMTVDSYTEDGLLELALKADPAPSPAAEPERLTDEQFNERMQLALDQRMKDLGLDKIDVKHLKLPGWEDALSTEEKKLLENPSMLTDKQKRALANKQLRSIVAPVANGQIQQRSLALNTETTDAVGLYLVPQQFIAEVSMLMENYGVMRRNANGFTMTSKTARKPKLNATTTGAYVTETSAKSESNPTFLQIDFTRHDYAFITGVTKQLLQDTGVDLIGLLAQLAAFDFSKGEDAQCFNGTTLTDYLAETGNGIVAVTTPAAATITNQNLIDMIFGTAFGESQNSKWYFHRTFLAKLLTLEDDVHRPIYTLTDQLNIMATRRFLGYPYELVEVMQPWSGNNYQGNADPPVAGDILAYFGDMRTAATLATRVGMEILMSDVATVGSNSAFEKNLVFWRFEHGHDFAVEQGKALTELVLGA